ncbi:MAG: radical SAM protein, partial [bacterium]
MRDAHNRHINYMRISITDRCNLHCRYCISQDNIKHCAHRELLSFEEIIRLTSIAIKLGISKVRITGGEPLVRNGVIELISRLHDIPGLH